jgi:deoxyribonuclease-4
MPYLGAHMSIAGGVDRALSRGQELGCEAVQIFTRSPNRWAARPLPAEEIVRFREEWQGSDIQCVFAHDSYLINLASPDSALWQRSVAAFHDEIERCQALGLPYLVTHAGAHRGSGEDAGLARVVEALDSVFQTTLGSSVLVLLEITAGQGSSLCYRFEHMAWILQHVQRPERVGVCVDTCHLFAAGYELRTEEGYGRTFRQLDATVGLGRVKAFHLNDSRRGLGSRVDRHAHIGEGQLGLEPFRLLLNDPRFQDHPMILETPKGPAMDEDRHNLAVLRALLREA